MFYLIGIGLKPGHITREARQALENCSQIFLDTYTSTYSEGSVEELKKEIGKEIVSLDRKGVEEGFHLVLRQAKESGQDVALLVFGNALSATTHVQLLLDAKKLGLKARVVAGISVYNFLGNAGLDQYRFGRTCTVVAPKPGYEPDSFYDVIESNFSRGMHTLCLLDIEAPESGEAPAGAGQPKAEPAGAGEKKMMSVAEALRLLEKIEKKKGKDVLKRATIVGLYALGSDKQMVKTAPLNVMLRSSFALFPQSLVVAAPLTGKEKQALEAFGSG
jgi:diphthine synthase